ncbi:MAG TPA: winged helix-turn-helix domain-containing protein, partial [Candidatus Limnocylindrales bacterium]|nr:winged helix-turn-helix domain-containing protein [Candidatus Limnocylindrales bacterium]
MDFSILGPVEATAQDGALSLGGPRQRALLAYLLLHANRVVAADQLASELWEAPPRDAHAALQNQVSRLRKALGERLVTHAPGYLLRVEAGELDLDRFRAAVADAGATSDLAERSRLLREADGFFRG